MHKGRGKVSAVVVAVVMVVVIEVLVVDVVVIVTPWILLLQKIHLIQICNEV